MWRQMQKQETTNTITQNHGHQFQYYHSMQPRYTSEVSQSVPITGPSQMHSDEKALDRQTNDENQLGSSQKSIVSSLLMTYSTHQDVPQNTPNSHDNVRIQIQSIPALSYMQSRRQKLRSHNVMRRQYQRKVATPPVDWFSPREVRRVENTRNVDHNLDGGHHKVVQQ